MAKQRKAWTFSAEKSPKASLPGTLKDEVDTKAGELIENGLKPKHIQPSPEGSQSNYITDITTKWIGSTRYFISVYACPGPNAIAPSFEEKFARKTLAESADWLFRHRADSSAESGDGAVRTGMGHRRRRGEGRHRLAAGGGLECFPVTR